MKFKNIIFVSLIGVMLTAFTALVHTSSATESVTDVTATNEVDQTTQIIQSPSVGDTDMDGLTDADEIQKYHTNPHSTDTDGDGYDDALEIRNEYSPLSSKLRLNQVDTDNDGLSDGVELKISTNLGNSDTNGNGHNDLEDIELGISPSTDINLPIEKRIEVNVAKFNLTYFFNNVPLSSAPVSTGLKRWPTPRGEFTIFNKLPERDYGGKPYSFYHPKTKWNLEFTTKTTNNIRLRYFIHGAYWHNEFGKKNVSSGCVNVAYENMEPLYKFASVGTKLIIR